jgi:hypothetical protein
MPRAMKPVASPTSPAMRSITGGAPLPSPTAPALAGLTGDLANQVARLETNMPRARSEGFVVPTDREKQAFGALAAKLAAGQPGLAAERYGYQVIRYTDREERGAESLMLSEQSPVQRAWGLYMFRIDPASNVIVEAPHPVSDEAISVIATCAYRALRARALLIAGARRDTNTDGSADVAHHTQSVFQAVHQAMAASGDALVLQFHGFAARRHNGYPQVVLASPQAGGGRVMERIASALRDEGLTVGVCNRDSRLKLCGQTNAQALASGGSIFIHLELDESIRRDAGALIAALERALGP